MSLKLLNMYCFWEEGQPPLALTLCKAKPYSSISPLCPFPSVHPRGPGNISTNISYRGRNPCLSTDFSNKNICQSSKYIPRLDDFWNAIPVFQLPPGLLVPDGLTHRDLKCNMPERVISLPDQFQFRIIRSHSVQIRELSQSELLKI